MTPRRSLLVILAIAFTASSIAAQNPQPWNFRPMSARATMSSPVSKRYNGTMQYTDLAKVCGEVPADHNMAGVAFFIIEFPDSETPGEISNVSFSSKELVGGKTESTKFMLNLSFKKPPVSPVMFVLDTNRTGETGTATLVRAKDGSLTLTVKGTNDFSESVDFVATCKPRP